MNVDSPDIMSASSDAPAEEVKPTPEAAAEEVTETSETEAEGKAETEADDTDDSSQSDTNGEDATAEPKKKRAQKRIDELTANWRQAERERDYFKQLVEQSQQPRTVSEGEPKLPTLEEVGYDDNAYAAAVRKYADDLADWKAAQREKAQTEQSKQLEAYKKTKSFEERQAAYAAQQADYLQVVQDPTLPITAVMAEAIVASELGPQMAYHLGKHREEAQRIAALSPTEAALALGRLEAKIAAPQATQKAISQAPAPAKPVGSRAVVEKAPEDMTYADYKAWRMKQTKR